MSGNLLNCTTNIPFDIIMAKKKEDIETSHELTFSETCKRIIQAIDYIGFNANEQVVSSRDPKLLKLKEMLQVNSHKSGCKKWHLPIILKGETLISFSIFPPGNFEKLSRQSNVYELIIVIGGSLFFEHQDYAVGDWIYIPKNKVFKYYAGDFGAVLIRLELSQ